MTGLESEHTQPQVQQLRTFTLEGYDKGRPLAVQALWVAVQNLVFSQWWCPASLRVALLRAFGATVGERVLVRHRVRVLWPWKLTVGDDVWVGEGAWLLNLEPVVLEDDVCLSQEAFLCTGSHDMGSTSFAYDNGPITVRRGAWVGTRATVLRGVTVGREAVVGAGVVQAVDLPDGEVAGLDGSRRPRRRVPRRR